jgi:AIPR protein.
MNPSSATFDDFKEEWLSSITERELTAVAKGNRFARKLLSQWLDFEEESLDVTFCDGGGDGGIDVAYLEPGDIDEEGNQQGNTWYLVQSKYGSAFAGTGTLLTESQKLIDTIDGKRERVSSLTDGVLQRLREFRRNAAEGRDRIVLVFATVDPLNEAETRAMADVRAVGRDRLGGLFDVEPISVMTIFQRLEEAIQTVHRNTLPITANLVQSGEGLLVGSMKIANLYQFLKDYRNLTHDLDMIYEKNVRRFLGMKRKVNKGIAETLMSTPERFGLYNNGITIVVEDFKLLELDKYQLTEPYIVNGCQTTRTIWEVLRSKLDSGATGTSPGLEAWKQQLGRAIVVAKIVKVGSQGEQLLTETTRYTNSQNAVSPRDFIALEKGFRGWARELATNYQMFLEVQRGGWESQKLLQKTRLKGEQFEQWANAFDLLKIYGAAWLGEPGLAFGKNPPFAPGGSIYRRIMQSETFGALDLYAAFLLSKTANKVKFGRGAEISTRGQTRFLFLFALTELLKECMLSANMDRTLDTLTRAVIAVFGANSEDAVESLVRSALNVVDDYLSQDHEDSVFNEPRFNGDLNAFLKSETLGKGKEQTPKLENLLALNRLAMRRKFHDAPSDRDLVVRALTSN